MGRNISDAILRMRSHDSAFVLLSRHSEARARCSSIAHYKLFTLRHRVEAVLDLFPLLLLLLDSGQLLVSLSFHAAAGLLLTLQKTSSVSDLGILARFDLSQ